MKVEEIKNDPRIPKHIGLIIDGNGRWAKQRGLARTIGHKYGFENLKHQIEFVRDLGIKNLSIYCFSTENWNRPKQEVEYLMELFDQMLDNFERDYLNKDVRIIISGNMDDHRLPEIVRTKAKSLMERTKFKTGFILNPCINYGGKQEILMAINACIKEGLTEVDEKTFEQHLYSAELLPLDLIIRTSGEQRASNFQIWQAAYAEWYYPKKFWPAFTENDLIKALKNYMTRDRRYGAIKEEK